MDDLTAATTKGALEAVANLSRDFTTFLPRKGGANSESSSVSLDSGFKRFLERNYRRYSKIKTY